jgi:hypothetical protein
LSAVSWGAELRKVNLLLDLVRDYSFNRVRHKHFDRVAKQIERATPDRRTIIVKVPDGYDNIRGELEGLLEFDETIGLFYVDSDSSPSISDWREDPELVWVLNGSVIHHPLSPDVIDESTFEKNNRILRNPFDGIKGKFSADAQILMNFSDHRTKGPWEVTQRADMLRHLLGVKEGEIFVSRQWAQLRTQLAILLPTAFAFYGSAMLAGASLRDGHPWLAAGYGCLMAIAYGINHIPDRLPRPGVLFEIREGEMRQKEAMFQHRYRRQALK